MKITRQVERTRTVVEIVDVVCNRCGASCKQDPNFCGLLEAQVTGCYGSPVLPDGATFEFSLCEACLGGLFSAFKHPPAATGGVFGEPPSGWRDGLPVYDGDASDDAEPT